VNQDSINFLATVCHVAYHRVMLESIEAYAHLEAWLMLIADSAQR
jgi:hypothetical protein